MVNNDASDHHLTVNNAASDHHHPSDHHPPHTLLLLCALPPGILLYSVRRIATMSTTLGASLITEQDFYIRGRDIQNRSGRVSTKTNEDKLFREFFGCSAANALRGWESLRSLVSHHPKGNRNTVCGPFSFASNTPSSGLLVEQLGVGGARLTPRPSKNGSSPLSRQFWTLSHIT